MGRPPPGPIWRAQQPMIRKMYGLISATGDSANRVLKRVPELPSTANDRHQQQPANMKLRRALKPRATHENTLVMRRSSGLLTGRLQVLGGLVALRWPSTATVSSSMETTRARPLLVVPLTRSPPITAADPAMVIFLPSRSMSFYRRVEQLAAACSGVGRDVEEGEQPVLLRGGQERPELVKAARLTERPGATLCVGRAHGKAARWSSPETR